MSDDNSQLENTNYGDRQRRKRANKRATRGGNEDYKHTDPRSDDPSLDEAITGQTLITQWLRKFIPDHDLGDEEE